MLSQTHLQNKPSVPIRPLLPLLANQVFAAGDCASPGPYPSCANQVFAAGDCASCTPYPRPKAGVYAVRQGPPLVNNLRAFLTGRPLEPFVPQSTNLSLIGTGEGWNGMEEWERELGSKGELISSSSSPSWRIPSLSKPRQATGTVWLPRGGWRSRALGCGTSRIRLTGASCGSTATCLMR